MGLHQKMRLHLQINKKVFASTLQRKQVIMRVPCLLPQRALLHLFMCADVWDTGGEILHHTVLSIAILLLDPIYKNFIIYYYL